MIILITGTSRGIGRFLAEYYLQKGYIVLGCSRSDPNLVHHNYFHYIVDATCEDEVRKMFFDIKKKWGAINVLLNNAGRASMNHFLLTPGSTAKDIFDINFFAAVSMIREAAKLFKKSDKGRIVNISTVAVPLNLEGEAVYAASKAALESLTKTLAKELAPYNITINAVGPTPIKTDLISGVPEEKLEKLLSYQAIKRYGRFEDLANVIDFFIDDKSDFITGQILYLGGVS